MTMMKNPIVFLGGMCIMLLAVSQVSAAFGVPPSARCCPSSGGSSFVLVSSTTPYHYSARTSSVRLSAASKATATATKSSSKTSDNNNNSKKALPTFDKTLNKWVYTADWQKPTEGYDKVGTLLRHGIPPFYNRVFKEEEYEQAVLKFMAGDQCYDRNVAQGNMDFFLRNAQDWMYNRMEDQTRGTKRDYVSLSIQQVILTVLWSIIVVAYFSFGSYSIYNRYFGPL